LKCSVAFAALQGVGQFTVEGAVEDFQLLEFAGQFRQQGKVLRFHVFQPDMEIRGCVPVLLVVGDPDRGGQGLQQAAFVVGEGRAPIHFGVP